MTISLFLKVCCISQNSAVLVYVLQPFSRKYPNTRQDLRMFQLVSNQNFKAATNRLRLLHFFHPNIWGNSMYKLRCKLRCKLFFLNVYHYSNVLHFPCQFKKQSFSSQMESLKVELQIYDKTNLATVQAVAVYQNT